VQPGAATPAGEQQENREPALDEEEPGQLGVPAAPLQPLPQEPAKPKPIFIGHGKKKAPLDKLEKILASFGIPYKTAVAEPNLGRPIPKKVKDTMSACGSAILIFTRDEEFKDIEGNTICTPMRIGS
jgi:hypothetical protein